MYFELILSVFLKRSEDECGLDQASELIVALQLERKTSHKHSCYYVVLYILCSMLQCFDL